MEPERRVRHRRQLIRGKGDIPVIVALQSGKRRVGERRKSKAATPDTFLNQCTYRY